MSIESKGPDSLLAAFLSGALLLASCGGGGSGGGVPPSGAVGGTIVQCGNMPVAGVTVEVLDENGDPLPQYETLSNPTGRWRATGLPEGTYGVRFVPPEGESLPPLEYHEVVVGVGENSFPPVSLPPLVGGAKVASNVATAQSATFHADPEDPASPEPLPGLSVSIPANTEIVTAAGARVAAGDAFTLQIGLVSPEALPMPFVDMDGNGRANQLYFTLQPAGTKFVEPGTSTPRLIQITYPNVNGLAPGTKVDLFRFDQAASDWVSAGTGTVDFTGALVEPDAGAGLPEAGWNAAPGEAPVTTTVRGQITKDGQPFARANIVVMTAAGFSGVTDESGAYEIPDVPLIGPGAPLLCTAFTDTSLAFEVASALAEPAYPETVCDIEILGADLDVVPPLCESTVPVHNTLDVATDQEVRVVFDELMDPRTVADSFVVTATDASGTRRVSGTFSFRTTTIFRGETAFPATEAIFVPGRSLSGKQDGFPADSAIQVIVTTRAKDRTGNALADACSFAFSTGEGPAMEPKVLAIFPEKGRVGSRVTLRGLHLDEVSTVEFAGVSLVPDSVAADAVVFTIPEGAGILPPGTKSVGATLSGEGGTLAAPSFTLCPRIVSVTPPKGTGDTAGMANDGTLVSILGHNLDGDLGERILFSAARAEIDGAMELVTPQRIDVRAPFMATSGAVVVFADQSGEGTLPSNPAFFTVETPPDLDPPVFLTSLPPDMAENVPVTTSIVVGMSEQVTRLSSLRVESGGVAIPGTTLVTAVAGGVAGRLTFVATNDLPDDSVIDVFVDGGQVFDLAGNGAVPHAFSFTTGDGPPPCLTAGKQELFQGNFQLSQDAFQTVVDDPLSTPAQVAEARLYLAVLDVVLAIDVEGTGPAAQALHDLLAGFGIAPPDLGGGGTTVVPVPLPSDSPGCAEVRDYLATIFLPVLEDAEAELAALPANFESCFPVVDPFGAVVAEIDIDATDVLALRMGLKSVLAVGYFVTAYGCELDIDALANFTGRLQPNEHFFDADPTLLALDPNPAAGMGRLQSAQGYLVDAVDLYCEALTSLKAETDDQSDDFITFDGETPAEIAESMMEADDVKVHLERGKAATSSPQTWVLSNGFNLMVDLGMPFTTLSLRDELPTLLDGKEFFALADLAAPILNGMFPNLTADQVNKILLVPPVDPPSYHAPVASIDPDDGSIADWAGLAPADTDPTGIQDILSTQKGGAMRATDIANVFIAQDAGSYFFRVDFAAGTPDPAVNAYSFDLEPNERGSTDPSFTGEIFNDGFGSFTLIFFDDDFATFFGPDASVVGEGPGFLEFSIPKSAFTSALVANGTEYVFYLETEERVFGDDDESGPIQLILDL